MVRGKQRLAVVPLALSVGLIAGACSSTTPTPAPTSGGSSEAPATSAPAGTTGPTEAAATSDNDCNGYPTRDIDFVVPYSPGGGFDRYARLAAPFLEKHLPNDVAVLVRNVEGAAGQVAAAQLMQAPPDGTRIDVLDPSSLVTAQVLSETPFDVLAYTYIGQFTAEDNVLVVSTNSPYETFQDLVDASAEKPILEATADQAVPDALIYNAFGVQWTPVLHEGGSEARLSVIRGDTDAYIGTLGGALGELQSGDFRALMYTGETLPAAGEPGAEELAGVPTIGELGQPDLSAAIRTPRIVGAPPELEPCIAEILDTAFGQAMTDPDLVAQAREQELLPVHADGAATAEAIATQLRVYEEYREILEGLDEG